MSEQAADGVGEDEDDLIALVEDDDVSGDPRRDVPPWRMLVLDDEPDVHEATEFALRGCEIFGRPIEMIHASSMAEGLEVMRREGNIAIALVDVVMETTDAGLRFVDTIRKEGMTDTRIVLRTGQPGYAPELSVVTRYDINDYRTKSELTRGRLLGVVTTALRGFRQLRQIAESRRGLELIIDATRDLAARDNLALFARGVLTQIASLLGTHPDGIVCVAQGDPETCVSLEHYMVIGDAGSLEGACGRPLASLEDERVRAAFEASREPDGLIDGDGALGMHFSCSSGRRFFFFVNPAVDIGEEVLSLLRVFSSNIAVFLERIELVEQLDQLAFIDTRIGIPNSNAFEREFEARLAREADALLVVMLSIDELDAITAVFGMATKVGVLIQIKERLMEVFGAEAFLAWSNSRRFDVMTKRGQYDPERVARAFAEPFQVGETELFVTITTIVLDVAANEALNGDAVQRLGAAAMASARKDRRGEVIHCDPSFGLAIEERHLMQSALRSALMGDQEIDVALQPLVDIEAGCIVGAEALVRWRRNDAMVPPDRFIPIAEASGLSWDITCKVLERIGVWVAARRSAGHADLRVAVNLSAADAQRSGFAKRLLARVETAGLSADNLEFEITESAMISEKHNAIGALVELRKAGFKIAIDDFGTGYSSLSQLDGLPVDLLKIDRAFISPLSATTALDSLAFLITSIARALRLDLIAEGIETHEQHRAVLLVGARVCQGYFYGKPVPIGEFDAVFATWSLEGVLTPG